MTGHTLNSICTDAFVTGGEKLKSQLELNPWASYTALAIEPLSNWDPIYWLILSQIDT